MKKETYEAPMAVVLNFENDYVMAPSGHPSKMRAPETSMSGGPTI